MTKYINRKRQRAENVRFTELKRRQHMSVILETKQLCKFYGAGENQVKAVNQVDIQIEQGEFVAIVGKSGSGKSTLLHMLGGLDTPTKGSVTLAGKDLYRMKEDALAVFRRRKIGFVFQAFNLVSSVNVWENIVLPLGMVCCFRYSCRHLLAHHLVATGSRRPLRRVHDFVCIPDYRLLPYHAVIRAEKPAQARERVEGKERERSIGRISSPHEACQKESHL